MKKFIQMFAVVAMFASAGILPAQATTLSATGTPTGIGCQNGTLLCTIGALGENGQAGRYDLNVLTGSYTFGALIPPPSTVGFASAGRSIVQQSGSLVGWNYFGTGGVVYDNTTPTQVTGVGPATITGITSSGLIVGLTGSGQVGYTADASTPMSIIPGFSSGVATSFGAIDVGGQSFIFGGGQQSPVSPTLAGYWSGNPGSFAFTQVFGTAAPGYSFGLLNAFSADGNVYAGGVDGMLCRGARNGFFSEECFDFGDPFLNILGVDVAGNIYGNGSGYNGFVWERGSSSIIDLRTYNLARGRDVAATDILRGYQQWYDPDNVLRDAVLLQGSVKFFSYESDFQPVTTVPEPGTFGLMALGAGLLAAHKRRRKS